MISGQICFACHNAIPVFTPFALQYNLLSIQFHVWLPDCHRLPEAFRQIPDDAAFLHWHKTVHITMQDHTLTQTFSPPSCFLQHDVLSISVCLVYIDIPEIVK